MRHAAAVMVVAALLCGSTYAANITVNKATQYQIFEGMGASVTSGYTIDPWKIKVGPFYQDIDMDAMGIWDTLITELGMSMVRTDIPGSFQGTRGSYTMTSGIQGLWDQLVKLRQAADRHGDEIRFICSCWSPPGWMKVSGVEAGGQEAAPNYYSTDCRLLDGYDDELGDHFTHWLKEFTAYTGLEYYALSLQNEPRFQEPYSSCVYNGARYTTTLKAVGNAMDTAGLSSTRLFGAEGMSHSFPYDFENAVRADAQALGYIDAWAVHGYTDGVETDTGAYSGSTPTDKPFWMTETSGGGYGSDWGDWSGGQSALGAAEKILSYLRDGKMAAWTWWTFGGGGANYEYSIWADSLPTLKYYITAHFARYIRPGARQVASTSNESLLKTVAFWHEQKQCLTIVLTNNSTTARTVDNLSISGGSVPDQFEKITSVHNNYLQHSIVNRTDQISVPANSIVTLVAGNYRGTPVKGDRPAGQLTPAYRGRAVAEVCVYAMDGTLVRRLSTNGLAASRVSWDYRDQDGNTVAAGIYPTVLVGVDGRRWDGGSFTRF